MLYTQDHVNKLIKALKHPVYFRGRSLSALQAATELTGEQCVELLFKVGAKPYKTKDKKVLYTLKS